MISKDKLSINKIARPDMSVTDFIRFASEAGASGIELRNDLPDPAIRGGQSADEITGAAQKYGIQVTTINALQRFNDPSLFEAKKKELDVMIDDALSVGCKIIVLCPVNDSDDPRSADQQRKDLEEALKTYAPIFKEKGVTGLIEPLGFTICSVRYKKQAVDAIKATGLESVYKIVHDTFHHFLSEETEVFPEFTGLVHISGVYEGKKKEDITDEDRVLIDKDDIMDNVGQVKKLLAGNCPAIFSWEPFSSVIQKMDEKELLDGFKTSTAYLFG